MTKQDSAIEYTMAEQDFLYAIDFIGQQYNYVDPEVSNLGNDLLSEFGETTGTSSTRNIGVNVKVVF